MSDVDNTRLQEGALSALKTPKSPPPSTRLVPVAPATADAKRS
ncbi:MAG TPA: hypothetical protein VFZ89_06550 [Solirubrobacteraceae bacterium]